MTTTPYELLGYYAGLLIRQYFSLPKAAGTIESLAGMGIMPVTPSVYSVTFTYPPTSGVFVLAYSGHSTAAINWNDSTAEVQTKVQAVSGLGSAVVTGTIASQQLLIIMNGITPPAAPITLVSSTLVNNNIGSDPLVTEGDDYVVTESGDEIDTDIMTVSIFPVCDEYDQTLPLAIMNGYNLTGPNPAVGVQLDVIGKYVGVTRSAFGFYSQITLDDADFLSFIKIAIVQNNSGSSLADIQQLLHNFFPGEILVFDYQDMHMDYVLATSIGSLNLLQLFITENLLPKPMGVQLGAIIFVPSVIMFGFRTYATPGYNVVPFNNYPNYNTTWPWLSYANNVTPP